MAQKSLQELSTEELNKQQSKLKIIIVIYAITGVLLVGLNVYQYVTKGRATTLILLIGLLPIVILVISSMKKIKAELKQRGEQS